MGASQSRRPSRNQTNAPLSTQSSMIAAMRSKSSLDIQEFLNIIEEELRINAYPSSNAETIQTECRGPTKPAPQFAERIVLHAKAFGEKEEGVVNATDGRSQILTTAKWPHCVHGVLSFRMNGHLGWGTGTLIGKNVLLTAGHLLYSHKYKVYADPETIEFLPAMNGQILPFGSVQVEQYFVSPNYENEEKEDYGIVILKEKVGEMTGYFSLACLKPEEILGKRINVTGYPSDKVASRPSIYEMWTMEGTASHIDEERGLIKYVIDTEAGQSGAGVWFEEGEKGYVCGVHVSGTHVVNHATLMTMAIYQQIETWLQQAGYNEPLLVVENSGLKLNRKNLEIQHLELLITYRLDDITILHLCDNKFGDRGAIVLAKNTSWTNLSKLKLNGNNIGPEGAKALAENPYWNSLSFLDLSINNLGVEGAQALSQNASWFNLSGLHLNGNDIRTEGVKALGQNTCWIKLSSLDLSNNGITTEGVKILAQNTCWRRLSELRLGWNKINAEGARAIAQNTCWINLRKLDLQKNNIRSKGVKALAENTFWTQLSVLNLNWNRINAIGAKALAENTSWINLSDLDLSFNKIRTQGAFYLAENTSWTKISSLACTWNYISQAGIDALRQNSHWKLLSEIKVIV